MRGNYKDCSSFHKRRIIIHKKSSTKVKPMEQFISNMKRVSSGTIFPDYTCISHLYNELIPEVNNVFFLTAFRNLSSAPHNANHDGLYTFLVPVPLISSKRYVDKSAPFFFFFLMKSEVSLLLHSIFCGKKKCRLSVLNSCF